VLKLQALLQFSQIVDMLALGDTSAERIQELIDEVDEADAAYANLKEECGIVEDDEKFNETSN
jgi:ABC-type multidrug transport system fused ATPase/permease subunit